MQPSPIAHRPEVLACPVCHGALAPHTGGAAACRTCGLAYPQKDGVYLLGPPFEVNGVRPAFGTPRMQRLLADSMECGWADAQKRFTSEVLGGGLKGPRASRLKRARAKLAGDTWEDTLHDLVDPTCAGWKFLLDLRPGAQVLFLGPSWGAAPIGLARSVDQVVVLDGAVERLGLMQQQAHGEDVHNLTFARVVDPVRLPLADGSVDLAIVPGLAEWFVAVAGHRPVPPNCGTELLRELRRVLGPRGQAFLAADNRRGLAWLVATRWLPGASYSPSALRRAAAEAGFEGCALFAPLPFRHKFHQIVDVERTDRMNFSIDAYRTRGRMVRPLVKAWDVVNRRGALERMLYPYLPGLSAVVSVDAQPRSFADRLVHHLGAEGRLPPPLPQLQGYHVRPKGAAVLTAGAPGAPGLIVRLPLDARAAATCALHHRSLTVMANDERIPTDIRRLFPAPLADGTFEGQTFFAETAVSGESGRRYYSRSVKRYDRAISSAAEVLRRLRRATEVPVRIDEAQWNRLCGTWLTELSTLVGDESRAPLEAIERLLRDTLVGQVLPLGWYHGDYDFANLLYGKDDAVSGVLDFEVFDAQGLPLMDLIVLLARRDIRRQGMAFGTLVARMIVGQALPPLEAGLLEAEMRAIGADARLYRALALCCWLNHLRLRRDSWLVRSPDWLHENLHGVVESVRSVL